MREVSLGLHQAPPTQPRTKTAKCRRGNNPYGHPAACPDPAHLTYTELDPEWDTNDEA